MCSNCWKHLAIFFDRMKNVLRCSSLKFFFQMAAEIRWSTAECTTPPSMKLAHDIHIKFRRSMIMVWIQDSWRGSLTEKFANKKVSYSLCRQHTNYLFVITCDQSNHRPGVNTGPAGLTGERERSTAYLVDLPSFEELVRLRNSLANPGHKPSAEPANRSFFSS